MTPTVTPASDLRGTLPGEFRHELVLHDGVDELVDLMVPFVQEGAARGEHLLVLGEPDFVRTLRAAVPDDAHLRARGEPEDARYAGRDLHRARQVISALTATGSPVRIVNQMPPMTVERWQEWRRYEAAANVVLAPYRAWGKCGHDRATLDPGMLADLQASHPLVQTPAGRWATPLLDAAGLPPDTFAHAPRHPLHGTQPTVSLHDPTPAAARRIVRDLAAGSRLSPTASECAILAAGETVTNAWVHGRAPVRLRAWARQPGRLTVAVSDTGPGPHPLVGMVPAPPHSPSGRGMWLVHLLLRDVHHHRDDGGYTITFSVDGDAPDVSLETRPAANG